MGNTDFQEYITVYNLINKGVNAFSGPILTSAWKKFNLDFLTNPDSYAKMPTIKAKTTVKGKKTNTPKAKITLKVKGKKEIKPKAGVKGSKTKGGLKAKVGLKSKVGVKAKVASKKRRLQDLKKSEKKDDKPAKKEEDTGLGESSNGLNGEDYSNKGQNKMVVKPAP